MDKDQRIEAERLDGRTTKGAIQIEAALTLLRCADESLSSARADISIVTSFLRRISKDGKQPGASPVRSRRSAAPVGTGMDRRERRRARLDSTKPGRRKKARVAGTNGRVERLRRSGLSEHIEATEGDW